MECPNLVYELRLPQSWISVYFLQGVSIALLCKPCISYDRDVRLSVCLSGQLQMFKVTTSGLPAARSHPHSPGEDTCLWRTEKTQFPGSCFPR